MTDHERNKWDAFLRERIPASEVSLVSALFRYFGSLPHEKKEMNSQETFIFKAALSYYEGTP